MSQAIGKECLCSWVEPEDEAEGLHIGTVTQWVMLRSKRTNIITRCETQRTLKIALETTVAFVVQPRFLSMLSFPYNVTASSFERSHSACPPCLRVSSAAVAIVASVVPCCRKVFEWRSSHLSILVSICSNDASSCSISNADPGKRAVMHCAGCVLTVARLTKPAVRFFARYLG